jgi:uncharacterized protein
MRWLDLLFAHWPVDAASLADRLPPGFELETYGGEAWLGVVPFTMADVAPRGFPAIPGISRFPELNIRTYVRHRGVPGVWFLSLDAMSWPIVLGGRAVFHVPYVHARMSSRRQSGAIVYRSTRNERRRPPTTFRASWRVTGPPSTSEAGSFDAWSTDRPRLFSVDGRGRVWRTEIAHAAWPLQPAVATIDAAALVATHGLTLPDTPPILRASTRLDVRAWLPMRA